MAEGKPVGQMYVELALDATKYTKAQKEILAGAEKNSADINKAFKTVGTKSDEIYNAMRQNIQNHLNAIKQSHLSSNDEIRRAKESAAAKIKAIDAEQFGVQTGFIDKWKKNWLAATAAVTAAYFALSKAWDLAEKAANFEQQKVGFANLAASYGSSGEKILESLKKVSSGTVDSMTLVNKAGTAMMMGIDPKKIVKLMEIARATTRVTGQSVTQAFDDISLAVARSSKLKLDNLGIIIDVARANEDYARELGTTADKLNDTQKKQAFLNESIKMGEELIKKMGEQTDTTRDKMDKLKVSLQEIQLLMGQGLIRAGLGLYGVFQMVAAAALKISQGIFKIAEGANALLDFVTFDNSLGGAQAKKDKQYWALQADAAGGASSELLQTAKDNFAAMTASSKDLASAMVKQTSDTGTTTPAVTKGGGGSADWTEWNIAKDVYEKAIDAAEYAAKMEITAGKDALTAKLEALDKQEAALETYYASATAAAQGNKDKLSQLDLEYNKDVQKYALERAQIIRKQELNILELKKTSADAQSEIDKKEIDLAKELYDAKAKYGGTSNLEDLKAEYEVKRKSLELDKQKLEAELLYVEAKGASQEKEKEILELKKKQKLLVMEINTLDEKEWIESKKYTGNFFEGWSSGIAQWRKSVGEEFEQAQDMAKTTAGAMKTAFSDGFYKLIKGESVSFTDIFASMFDTILKKFTDMCAEMVVKWITSKEAMAVAGAAISAVGTGLSAILGGLFHEGGIVGEGGSSRLMPAYAFAGAPRLHNGLAADEYPAILQKGEEVIPKNKVGKSKEEKNEGANITQNTFNISAVDAKSFADLCNRNPSAIVGPMMSSMKSNKTRSDMRKLLK